MKLKSIRVHLASRKHNFPIKRPISILQVPFDSLDWCGSSGNTYIAVTGSVRSLLEVIHDHCFISRKNARTCDMTYKIHAVISPGIGGI